MAKYIVPSKQTIIIRCANCKTLYVPEHKGEYYYLGYFESCPSCGYSQNDGSNKIPLWLYNLIKWWRER